jgi:hypothetical protein
MNGDQIYLGDGVYASVVGEMMIKLEANRDEGAHFIYLEYETFRALVEFGKRIGWAKTEIDAEALDALQRKAGLK